MATKALISMEEHRRTSYEGLAREFVDGAVAERAIPPFEHGKLQIIWGELFRRYRKQHGFQVVAEVR